MGGGVDCRTRSDEDNTRMLNTRLPTLSKHQLWVLNPTRPIWQGVLKENIGR